MKFPKILTPLFILFFVSTYACSQSDSTLYKVKIDQYQSWQKTGTAVAITGAVVGAAGIGLIVGGFAVDEDLYYNMGYGFTGLGITTTVTGLIFRGIGKRKQREYKIRLEDLRLGFYYSPRQSGFALTYRF